MTRQEELDITSGMAILEKYGVPTSAPTTRTSVVRKEADWLSMLDDSFFESSDDDDSDSDSDSSSEEEDEEMEETEAEEEDDDKEEMDVSLEEADDIDSQASSECDCTDEAEPSLSGLSDLIRMRSEEDEDGLGCGQSSRDNSISGLTDLILSRSQEEDEVDETPGAGNISTSTAA